MNATNTPKFRPPKPPFKADTVDCIICEKPHIRRDGPAHINNPVCHKCDQGLSKPSTPVTDTVDFRVKGF
jgi:hypothetical protein